MRIFKLLFFRKMRRVTFILLSVSVCWPGVLLAQKQAYNWYFGQGTGLHFGENSVDVLKDGRNVDYYEACSSISDQNRNLLFYSNGYSVYDRNHHDMPNGDHLKGNIPDDVALSVIVPSPAGNNTYYIFSCDRYGPRLSYSIVDLSLNGGLGEVTTKNITVSTSVTGNLSASLHSNGVDYWITVHEYFTNRFLSYRVTSAGIDTTPVVSAVGSVHSENPPKQIKVSPDGSKIAITFQRDDYSSTSLEVFRFNSATGKVGSLIFSISTHEPGITTSLRNLTGIEFSRGGDLIYVSNVDSSGSNNIYQFDLSSGVASTIRQSIFIIGTPRHGLEYCMQMGPDEKIYIVYGGGFGWGNVSRINDPNKKGAACNYIEGDIYLEGYEAILYLPIFIQGDFAQPPVITSDPWCLLNAITFEGSYLGAYDSCVWSFDDPATTDHNKALGPTSSHIFSHAGTFNVTLKIYQDGNVLRTLTESIKLDPIPSIELGNEKTICKGNTVALGVVDEGYTYSWSTGQTTAFINTNASGWYRLVADNGQCSVKDSIQVKVLEVPVIDLPEEIKTCTWPVRLASGNAHYQRAWSTGETTENIQVTASGEYFVKVSNNICTVSDTVQVTFEGIDDLEAGADKTSVSFNESISFTASATAIESWDWSFDDGTSSSLRDPAHTFSIAGTYTVSVNAVNHYGCIDSVRIPVIVNPHLFIPNVFTPGNNDAKNEVFEIQYNGDESYHLTIFNRWGQQVFSTVDRTLFWRGDNAESGIYYYHLTIGSKHYNGWVHLLRS